MPSSIENPSSDREQRESLQKRITSDSQPESKEHAETQDPIERVIEEKTGAIATKNKTEVYASGQDFFKTLESEIGSAKKSIHINVFSFANDSSGHAIADALIEAKKKNPALTIDIRVDRIGSFVVGSKDSLVTLLPGAAEVLGSFGLLGADGLQQAWAILRDPSAIHDLLKEDQENWKKAMDLMVTDELLLSQNAPLRKLKGAGIPLAIERNDLSAMDHSKVFIFDDTSLYTGGMNVGDDYSGGYHPKRGWDGSKKSDYWKDYMVKMQGGATDIQKKLFFGEGSVGTPAAVSENGDAIRVLHNAGGASSSAESFPKEKQISFATYHLLENASTEILVEHAYIMDQTIVDLLLKAAARGVDVKIVRSKPESAGLEAANERYFSQLEGQPGIQVVKSECVLHTKLICVDSKYSIIGSANLTKESLQYHEETSLFIARNGTQQKLDESLGQVFGTAFGETLVSK